MAEIFQEIPVNLIDPSPYQHRRNFAKNKLNELANSIKRDGLIEPVVARAQNGRYELIAGERRWRAAQLAELDTILTKVIEVSDLQARRMCAAENLQREDLSAEEEIRAIVEIIDAELIEDDYYRLFGNDPVIRVIRFLRKRQSAEKRGYVNNFGNVTERIDITMKGLPNPKEWESFLRNDLPILTKTDDDVKNLAARIKASKAKTLALQKLKERARKQFDDLQGQVKQADDNGDDLEDVTIQAGLFDDDIVSITEASAKDIERATIAGRILDARDEIPGFTTTPPFPENKYRCIVLDPPWPIQKIERQERPDQGMTLDYPTMTLEEIEALPIPKLALEDGCHLYLWVTQKYLPVGLDLVEKWGFRYECLMTWRKNVGITPFSWMYDTEHVIFARLGSLPLQRMGLRLSFDGKVTDHSTKPEAFYDERVILASPTPRLEMFARKQRNHFEVWGNEVDGPGC